MKIVLFALISLFLISGCVQDSPVVVPVDDSGATHEAVSAVVDGSNQFALDLYKEYSAEEKNIFFSPWSISSALAMTYEGAREKTAEEMKEVLHFSESSLMRPGFAKLTNQINSADNSYKLSTANALWPEENYVFLQDYLDLTQKYYGSKITNLDYVNKSEESRVIINSWVEEKTNNKIKDLIPQGLITPDTALVLTNAIYFKGNWFTQFKEENTLENDFKVSSDKKVKAQMMHAFGEDAEFKYGENNELKIIELPYVEEELSMLVILPNEGSLDSVEQSFSIEKLEEWKSTLVKQQVGLYLPKFKFETKYSMSETLQEMGMPTAFSPSADFSGMTGKKDLFISAVIHQAFVEVNEEGTEAAAATAVIMDKLEAMPKPIPEFKADHPFIFIIQENETGNILFMGRVIDPTAS